MVGVLRTEPVLPLKLPDYELTTLDVTKEVVFHIGNQTAVGRIPILVYIPVRRSGQAAAVDRLVQARTLLLKATASAGVSTMQLAALRDLLEGALRDLRDERGPS